MKPEPEPYYPAHRAHARVLSDIIDTPSDTPDLGPDDDSEEKPPRKTEF